MCDYICLSFSLYRLKIREYILVLYLSERCEVFRVSLIVMNEATRGRAQSGLINLMLFVELVWSCKRHHKMR